MNEEGRGHVGSLQILCLPSNPFTECRWNYSSGTQTVSVKHKNKDPRAAADLYIRNGVSKHAPTSMQCILHDLYQYSAMSSRSDANLLMASSLG